MLDDDNEDGVMADGRLIISVRGIVQGVGFRPYVYGLAVSMGLAGTVANTGEGVVIEVEGAGAEAFPRKLREGLPSLARISSMEIESSASVGYADFSILSSRQGGGFTMIPPDVSLCDECARELFDPADRRYRYPFINCTNCGPRYSIILRTPYDRAKTTMAAFEMCPECRAEYDNPSARRFHAEPNACPACGPRVWLVREGLEVAADAPVQEAVRLMGQGKILALKGLGGFHLACDALNHLAVVELRRRKGRVRKPFALMGRSIEIIRRYCRVSEDEEALLSSPRRPVVLLERRRDAADLPDSIAPGCGYLGFMLPYTPLHALVMEGLEVAVMTSGNLSEEPIQYRNDEALRVLAPLADAFLLHDRDIFMRVDDSVLRAAPGGLAGNADSGDGTNFIRRARGYVPDAVPLVSGGPDVLAVGADMKNTFALLRHDWAVISQHMGDMDKYETVVFFEETLENLKTLFRAAPVALAHDMHPGYGSTRWAMSQSLPRLAVQHHHAHIASVIAEHGLGRVLGIALDGTGYGGPSAHKSDVTDMEKGDSVPGMEKGGHAPALGMEKGGHAPALGMEKGDGVPGMEKGGHAPALGMEKGDSVPGKEKGDHVPAPGMEKGGYAPALGMEKGDSVPEKEKGDHVPAPVELWGGEFMLADLRGFERLGHFAYMRLPGGESAIREPWRIAVALIDHIFGGRAPEVLDDLGFYAVHGQRTVADVMKVAEIAHVSPLSSGAGRLFDAAAALLGLCPRSSFEGEAAMALEGAAAGAMAVSEEYPYDIVRGQGGLVIDMSAAISQMVRDAIKGQPASLSAMIFHNTVAAAATEVTVRLAAEHGVRDVALSGGVFQNRILLGSMISRLSRAGLNVYANRMVPPNDAGISLGQAVILRERIDHAC